MELLFKRQQTPGRLTRVNFELWGKIELDDNETEIMKRYRFDQAVLIEAIQPSLIRNTLLVAFGIFVLVFAFLMIYWSTRGGFFVGLLSGCGAGYWYFHEKRETIFVRDLLHGRHFKCDTVIELARKEAWLATIVSFLRQVMETAKHWDGTERHDVLPLPKDEARQVIIKGI
ncbi:MAG: hypothetical protein H6842_05440 [Rhodospirillaceae bacterium]|nr:hypothetical protein [Rhodospirillaceae bacterium]